MKAGFIEAPQVDELLAFSKKCSAFGDSIRHSRGFIGVAAYRTAMDLDYLARLLKDEPIRHVGQWTLVVKAKGKAKRKLRVERQSARAEGAD